VQVLETKWVNKRIVRKKANELIQVVLKYANNQRLIL
jgi:hypothetical protein